MANALSHHVPRVRHQLGELMRIGGRGYRVRGYLANRQATSLAHEPHLLRVLARAMTQRTGPVLDVGANTGQTLLKILSIDPGRAYIGVEPQVGCCYCLAQFLMDNGLDRAQILPLAFSDRDGLIQLHGASPFDEMTGAAPRRGTKAFWAMARIGDRALEELSLPDPGIIKIDVEGAELEALCGLRATIARARPVVFFELLPNFRGEDRIYLSDPDRARNRARAGQIGALFAEFGYSLQQISDDGTCRTIRSFALDDREGYVGRDYVAWPPLSDRDDREITAIPDMSDETGWPE